MIAPIHTDEPQTPIHEPLLMRSNFLASVMTLDLCFTWLCRCGNVYGAMGKNILRFPWRRWMTTFEDIFELAYTFRLCEPSAMPLPGNPCFLMSFCKSKC